VAGRALPREDLPPLFVGAAAGRQAAAARHDVDIDRSDLLGTRCRAEVIRPAVALLRQREGRAEAHRSTDHGCEQKHPMHGHCLRSHRSRPPSSGWH
jgi:hypothetical protein